MNPNQKPHKPCHTWKFGHPIGVFCEKCYHLDVAHDRAGVCALCAYTREPEVECLDCVVIVDADGDAATILCRDHRGRHSKVQ